MSEAANGRLPPAVSSYYEAEHVCFLLLVPVADTSAPGSIQFTAGRRKRKLAPRWRFRFAQLTPTLQTILRSVQGIYFASFSIVFCSRSVQKLHFSCLIGSHFFSRRRMPATSRHLVGLVRRELIQNTFHHANTLQYQNVNRVLSSYIPSPNCRCMHILYLIVIFRWLPCFCNCC